MWLEVKTSIYIDIDDIISGNDLSSKSSLQEIEASVENYVEDLDEPYYSILTEEYVQKIINEINHTLRENK